MAKPFIKWAGGKTQLLAQFELLIPQDLNNTDRFYIYRALCWWWCYVILYVAKVPQYESSYNQ